MLYDYAGRPVQTQKLTQELAAATLTGIRTVWQDGIATGLTPQRLASILLAAAQGDPRDYLTLAEEMEERELHYHSVLSTRKLAVSGLEVTVEAASEEKRDVEIADAVRELVKRPDFQDLLDDLLDGIAKGYSVCEIMWDRSSRQWNPSGFEWRDPRFFTFDRVAFKRILLLDEKDPVNGSELQGFKFIVHQPRLKTGIPIRGGLARLAAGIYMCKSYGLRDWMAFMETYGLPWRIGRYGPGAKQEDIDTLVAAVANLGSDAAAVLPDSMRIDLEQAAASVSGSDNFKTLEDWLDKQTSKAVLGQTMTADDGASKSQATVHNDVRKDLLVADGRQVAKTLNRDLTIPFVRLNYGEQKVYPSIRIKPAQLEDLKTLSEALPPFIDRGLQVEADEIRSKFRLRQPKAKAEVLGAKRAPEPPPAAAGDGAPAAAKVAANRQEPGAGATMDPTRPLDELAGEADSEWRRMMDPMLHPIEALAKRCKTYEEFNAQLPSVLAEMDGGELLKHLAAMLFKARGLGDGTPTAG